MSQELWITVFISQLCFFFTHLSFSLALICGVFRNMGEIIMIFSLQCVNLRLLVALLGGME